MRRSSGVTAAAVVLILVAVYFCVHALWTLKTAAFSPKSAHEFVGFLIFPLAELAFAIWGLVIGTGLLRLRQWAWACILVFSGLLIAGGVLGLPNAFTLIHATTGVTTISAGHFIRDEYSRLVRDTIVPLVLGVWWLVFLSLRRVRLQFAGSREGRDLASGVLSPLGDMRQTPARSGDVTAAAIVLFVFSGFLILMAGLLPMTLFMSSPHGPDLSPIRGVLVGAAAMYFLLAAWGVVTGIGVVKRRGWGRVSMIIMGAAGIAVPVLGSAGVFAAASANTREPRGGVIAVLIGGAIALALPLGVSIWWLVLFTRKRVALEFAPQLATDSPLPLIATELAVAAPQFVGPRPGPQIPLSIRVVAVVEILFAAMGLVGAPMFTMGIQPPVLIFGFLAHGWATYAFFIVSAIVPLLFSIAILKKQLWGLDGLVVFLVAQLLNAALFFVSPSRAAYDAALRTEMDVLAVRMKMPASQLTTGHELSFQIAGVGFSAVVFAVVLYLLVTRRKTFRDACAG